jgi:Protein of unknown function (DUF3800)
MRIAVARPDPRRSVVSRLSPPPPGSQPLHAFVDESYWEDLYLLVALVVAPERLPKLDSDLDELVKKTGRRWGWPPDTELHGVDVFQHKGAFLALDGKMNEKTRIFETVYWKLDEADATIIVVNLTATGWSRQRKVARDLQRFIAMEQLVEQIGLLAQEANRTVEVIFDTDAKTDHAVAACFNDVHAEHVKAGTAWLNRPAVAGDSALHRGLQAADMVAYIELRYTRITRKLDSSVSPVVHRVVVRLAGFLIQRVIYRHVRDGILRIHWR